MVSHITSMTDIPGDTVIVNYIFQINQSPPPQAVDHMICTSSEPFKNHRALCQIPNSKSQITNKFQVPKTKHLKNRS